MPTSTPPLATPETILKFWFGDRPIHVSPDYLDERMQLWFGGGEKTDRLIRDRFGETVEAAAAKKLESWKDDAESALAWILLMDQFALNIFRDQPRSFELSAAAIPLSQKMIESGWDQRLHPIERSFVYLPLEHAEDLGIQEQAVEQFRRLKDSALENSPEELKGALESFHWYAVEHWKVVERFGRFPDRNEIFGRSNTAEEQAYLEAGGPPF